MVWTTYQFTVAAVSLITCTSDIIMMKAIARTESKASDDETRVFHHPFFIATLLFFGEIFMLFYFYLLLMCLRRRKDGSEDRNKLTMGDRNVNPLYNITPAMFEAISSFTGYIGLNLTYISSYQALKTSVIIFTAIFSIIFLKRKITIQHWTGIAIIIVGLISVTLGDYYTPRSTPKIYQTRDIIIGDMLVLLAQVVKAGQNVVEELIVANKDSQPLQAIGWQGIFGFTAMVIFLTIAYFIPCPRPIAVNSRQTLEDAIDAFVQISNSTQLLVLCLSFIAIVGPCKTAGINLTKEFSCVLRRVFDSLRIILLYGWGMLVFGQKLHFLHPIGFILVIFGVSLHNNVIGKHTARWIGIKSHCVKESTGEEGGEDAETVDTKTK